MSEDASVGVELPPGQSGWLAHVQMFPLAFASPAGEPNPATTVDVTVSLPTLAETGIVEVTVALPTANVGQPLGSASSPVDPVYGPPGGTSVGTWAPAQRVGCRNTSRPGEVCIPGGAFWMGTTRVANPPLAQLAYLQPRLVVLSPFFLDAGEVTVAAYRASGGAVAVPWTGSSTGENPDDWCTFTATPGPHDAQPLNCVTSDEARPYCQSKGGDLPTEAQWEYAAGGLVGSMFVWGSDLPQCGNAIYGLAGRGYFGALISVCPPGAFPGEAPVPLDDGGRAIDAGGLDELRLEGGTVYDLAGNLAELTLDAWDTSDGPCWSAARVYTDPICGDVGRAKYRAVRGGAWYLAGNTLAAVSRVMTSSAGYAVADGFRCARPDSP